jgi:protein-tyrosine phosphatase
MSVPVPDSYWVVEGHLLAGEYPGAKVEADALERLSAFQAAGVTSYVDLTEEDEGLTLYERLLPSATRYTQLSIRDYDCPTREEMRTILTTIDSELDRGGVVCVHCWGGHGRTGTVIGCWLVEHGRSGEEALAEIERLRANTPDAASIPSPENDQQRDLVRTWE